MTDPLDLDAVGQAELIRNGELTPAELTEACIARIDASNPPVNAVIHRFDDRAVEHARQATGESPFRGVPFLVKDAVCHTADDPYHLGMRFLKERDWHEDHDTWLAGRFREAGFVFVGKTNTPELASAATTEPLAYGPTRNPWDPARSTGGSSGGAAAAVAAGMVAAAHGNDMGGSIRNPASQCGLVGLKPTRGRTSLGPDVGSFWGPLTHEGVLTRSVRDTAAILDAVAGNAPGDPYLAPPLARPLRHEVGAEAGSLRIGVTTTIPGTGRPADRDCVVAVERTAALLAELGHRVDLQAPDALADHDVLTGPLGTIVCVGIARDLARWEQRTGAPIGPDDVEPGNWMMAEIGRAVDGVGWLENLERFEHEARSLLSWWSDGHDLLLLPTIGITPPRLGVLGGEGADPVAALSLLATLTATLSPWNTTGQPAISLPLHWTDDGLPVGIQLVAATGREDLLVRVAAKLEQARPWADRRPPPPILR